jgi:alpha-1,6-mannosyltransferase
MGTLHITNAYHPGSGCVRTFYDALLAAANRESRRVVIVAPGRSSETVDVGQYGRIEFIKAPRVAFDAQSRLILPHQYLPGLASALVRILERERPSVVEICDSRSLPYLAAMLRKGWHPRVQRPTLVGLSCSRLDDRLAAYLMPYPARAFARWYIRHVYGPSFDAHIAISEYTAAELRGALPDRPPGFIRVAPFGVEPAQYRGDSRDEAMRGRILRQMGGHDRSVLLLHAGRLVPGRNLGLLIDMLRELVQLGDADYRLLIAGNGPLAAWMLSHARGPLAGRIHCWGVLEDEALASCYANCDVFVCPNPCAGFGVAPLEAMASGVPVVLPDRGGVLEYASERSAWLAAPDARSFAAAVTAARGGDPERRRSAIQVATQLRWSQVTNHYFALYDELQGRYSGSPIREAAPVPIA